MTIAELRREVAKSLPVMRESLESIEPEKENPSVADMYYRMAGRLELLEALNDALNGNKVAWRLHIRA